MSANKNDPILHRGIKARRVYPFAPNHVNVGRETDRAGSLESEILMLDFFTLLEFDLNVEYFQRQPVMIRYVAQMGKSTSFKPEFLITYRRNAKSTRPLKPLLCDVMTRADAFSNWADSKNRLWAAHRYAMRRDWRYRILTERDIATPYLENARMLLPYRKFRTDIDCEYLLLDTLARLGAVKAEALLSECSRALNDRASLDTCFYHLVSFGVIGANLRALFNTQSYVWHLD